MLSVLHPKPSVLVPLVPTLVHVAPTRPTDSLTTVWAGVPVGVVLRVRVSLGAMGSAFPGPIRPFTSVRGNSHGVSKISQLDGTQPRPHLLYGVERIFPTQRNAAERGAALTMNPRADGAAIEQASESPKTLRVAHRNGERDRPVLGSVDTPLSVHKTGRPSKFSLVHTCQVYHRNI